MKIVFFLASSESLLSYCLLANLDLQTGRELFLCGDPLPSARCLSILLFTSFYLGNGLIYFSRPGVLKILRTYDSYFEYFQGRNCDEDK